MKIDVMEIKENDVVMIHAGVGNIPPSDIDPYIKKIMPILRSVFGSKVAVIPTRDGNELDFTIIRKPVVEKIKKVASNHKK